MNKSLVLMLTVLLLALMVTKAFAKDPDLTVLNQCVKANIGSCDEGYLPSRVKVLHGCVILSKQVCYKKDVLPIMKEMCANCHNPGWKDKDFTDYKTAKENAGKIKTRAVIEKTMPPGNITGITDEERETLGKWVDEGANP